MKGDPTKNEPAAESSHGVDLGRGVDHGGVAEDELSPEQLAEADREVRLSWNEAERVGQELVADAEPLELDDDASEDLEDEDEEEDRDSNKAPGLGEEDFDPFDHHDPLAPAYDLDAGQLIDKGRGSHPPFRSDVRSPKEFFNTEIIYRYDIIEDPDRAQLAGTYRVELKGYQGGVWTVVLGDDINVVNRKDDAEIVLVMHQKDFMELVNGQLNPQLAILAQKIKISGDMKKASLFQSVLGPQSD